MRPTRSDKYQYLILERAVDTPFLHSFSLHDGLYSANDALVEEQLYTLRERMKKRMYELMEIHLTERQKILINMWTDGYTQMEMAKILGINQSSVTKSIHGNVEYKSGRKVYGGTIKKMKKLVVDDPEMQEIFREMDDLLSP